MPDLNRLGSILVAINYDGKAVAGGELTIYRVGDIVEENGDYSFSLNDRFAPLGITTEKLLSSETAKKLSDFIVKHGIEGETKKIDTNGKVEFEELKPGLYLLTQKKAASGYQKLNPFLVSLPMGEADGYSYHVDASPKISLMPKPPANTEQPETGQSIWPVWIFLFSSVMLVLFVRKRKDI